MALFYLILKNPLLVGDVYLTAQKTEIFIYKLLLNSYNMGYFPQGATAIYNEQIVERTAPAMVELDRALGGEAKYGKLHLREDIKPWLEEWMAPKDMVEYVPAKESVGVVIPTVGEPHIANIVGTTLAHGEIELNMRDVGRYLSLHRNFQEHLMNYLKSREGQELAAFLNEKGLKAEDIGYVGIGFVPEDSIFAVGRADDGKIMILANSNSYNMVKDNAGFSGLKEGEFEQRAIGEEMVHIYRISSHKYRGMIGEEKIARRMLIEFYDGLAKNTSNPQLKAEYSRIIRQLKEDLKTVAKRYSSSNSLDSLVSLYNSDMSELVQALAAEAIYERGIDTETGIQNYVSSRLEEVAEAASKSSTRDSTKNADGEKGSEDSDSESAGCKASAKDKGGNEEATEGGDAAEGTSGNSEGGSEGSGEGSSGEGE